MPYFHALAVFEACGSSPDEIQETVSALFDSLSHQRVRYYEHELSEGLSAPTSSGGPHYCMVFADFDVDAYTEEKAMDFAGDALDYISTETCQFLVLGIVPGKQRVQPKREEARQSDQDERGGRRRSTRGRGRQERQEREAVAAGPVRETSEEALDEPASQTNEVLLPESEVSALEMEPSVIEVSSRPAEQAELAEQAEEGARSTPPPPSRSSGSMRVTVTVKLRASELVDIQNGGTTADQQDLIQQAIAEARSRHPEVPADVSPESESTPLPGGDTLFSLTWQYAAPVPSAKDAF